MRFRPGAVLGRYEIVSAVGSGTLGELYRAYDRRLYVVDNRTITGIYDVTRFDATARVLASLEDSRLVTVGDSPDGDALCAIVTPFVDGPTLAEQLAQHPLTVDHALAIANSIADVMRSAHQRDLVHGELKPSNIKLRDGRTVTLLECGLAIRLDPEPYRDLTMFDDAPARVHTAAYRSPERVLGRPADAAGDVWSFGCVVYEMLSGRRAFGGDNARETFAHPSPVPY